MGFICGQHRVFPGQRYLQFDDETCLWYRRLYLQADQGFAGKKFGFYGSERIGDVLGGVPIFLPITDPWDERYICLDEWLIFMLNVLSWIYQSNGSYGYWLVNNGSHKGLIIILILLMVQKSQGQPPFGCQKTHKSWDKVYLFKQYLSTLPPIIMVLWKMGVSPILVPSFRVIFHFHDFGRKIIVPRFGDLFCRILRKNDVFLLFLGGTFCLNTVQYIVGSCATGSKWLNWQLYCILLGTPWKTHIEPENHLFEEENLFTPYLGKIPILTNIFQRGWK